MKPLMLQGHERAITQIKYNREGDLLFSAAKDSKPNVWWSLNGERLGTFNGHGGVVWCLDVDWQSVNLITGGGDSSCRLWDLKNRHKHCHSENKLICEDMQLQLQCLPSCLHHRQGYGSPV